MSLAKQHRLNNTLSARDAKQQVLVCLNKLSDRDTHTAAATELENIAKTLNPESVPLFLSSISTINTLDKSPVRKQCVRVISTLSETHGDILSPYLTKLLSLVVYRLRDPDTVVRTACVAASGSVACHVTKPPFTSVAKPFVDALVMEQDVNAQTGAALCLASVVTSAPYPDKAYLRRVMNRVEKLLRSVSFKAKAALLSVVVSVVSVGACSSAAIVKNLVEMMTEFVAKSEDWSVRKAAAEVLEKLAVVEADLLPEYKAACLKTFEAIKFDKVKGVRETMNQMIEAWNAVQDLTVEVSPPPESQSSSSKEEADIQNAPRTSPLASKRTVSYGSSTGTTGARRNSFEHTSRKTGQAMFRKLDRKKPVDKKLDTTDGQQYIKSRSLKHETKRPLVTEICDEKTSESQYGDDVSSFGVAACTLNSSIDPVQQESEDLSMIRDQLVKIESQQSNLFDLLQKYIASTQDGMRSLESRVLGLESILDDISFDLAKSTGRLSGHEPTLCWKLPGSDLFSSKLWKKSEIQPSNMRYTSSAKKNSLESYNVQTNEFHLHGGGSGLIQNLLAKEREM